MGLLWKVDDDDDDGFSITRETTHTTVVYRASSQRCINVSRINGTRRVASHRNAKFFCPLPLLRPFLPSFSFSQLARSSS